MIKFHSHGMIKDWFEKLNPHMRHVMVDLDILAQQKGYDLLVTSIYRSVDDHKALCKKYGWKYYNTPHSIWNAVDCVPQDRHDRHKPIDTSKMKELVDKINKLHVYGDDRDTIMWHFGTGWHFHLQVNYRVHGLGR